ncbi:LytR/AlgR family response regulator transcription factor [Marinilabilia rubra]|uniref:DNA-binding response regulator n=1 Tax=Marinilabilia rubra TaxID=2162893 RepID=A0A2U2BBQ8_9BACT|nr:LytTR family DNA-binding domain-containing protein [Marinilabilia rubra]PWE00467.1 DNA-binding response regulator [Marinilabilia rubra]
MKIRCVIIDDEFPARALLKDFIERFPHLELAGAFKSPLEALPLLQSGKANLVFLDIQMPEISGMEFLKAFNLRDILVVITSAYPEYALEGYQLDVIDYLLKPFSFERFVQSVQKAGSRLQKSNPAEIKGGAVSDPSNEYVIVKADYKSYRVKISDILFIEGMREYVTFHCVNQKLVSLESLKNLMESLPANVFMRIHKSFIVNRNQVKALYGNQLQLLNTEKTVPIGQSYREEVKKNLFNS